jgi:transcriptional regulator with XRE-family HTH domain
MRKKLGWSQEDLAKASNLTQGVVSRAEDSDYGNLTFNTVLRIAAGLDVAFVGRFVPFSDAAKWFSNLSEESVQIPTFQEEDKETEKRGDAAVGTLYQEHRFTVNAQFPVTLGGIKYATIGRYSPHQIKTGPFRTIISTDWGLGSGGWERSALQPGASAPENIIPLLEVSQDISQELKWMKRAQPESREKRIEDAA